jgi:plasmid stabilization system protein ParE
MRLAYLDSAKPDLAWFQVYYSSIFPEGAAQATARYVNTIDILVRNPYIGRPIGQDGLRRLPIPKTPFSVFYRIVEDFIEIVRVWDQRRDPEKLEFHEEAVTFT